MTYDPFSRGQYPVGVATVDRIDVAGATRALEVWYPAADRFAQQDMVPETQDLYTIVAAFRVRQEAVRDAEPRGESFPLLAFSHGFAGHRRQSTFLCTHLASHGYVVVSPEHGGSNLEDLVAAAMRVGTAGLATSAKEFFARQAAERPRDLDAVVRAALAGALPAAIPPVAGAVGLLGHSFGGYTALATASLNDSVGAVAALAPAGGAGPLATDAWTRSLPLDYAGRVSTLYLALERDSLLPLEGIEGLYRRTSQPARMLVLPKADHMHFADRAASSHEFFRHQPLLGMLGGLLPRIPPFAELAPEQHGYDFARACCVAHFDATLKASADARRFLESELLGAFAARGVELVETRDA